MIYRFDTWLVRSLLLCNVLSISSCSFWREAAVPTRAELASEREISNEEIGVAIEPFSSSEQEPKFSLTQPEIGLEITWDIPSEPVDTFVLYSGSEPDNLNTEIHLSALDLSIVQGSKYRYVLKQIKSGSPVYVSLAAIANGVVSPRSAVQRFDADEHENR